MKLLQLTGSSLIRSYLFFCRQNLNSDFTDSALGSSDKSPLPYGNFQLRDTTVHSILNHPRYGPKSPLGSNMYTYLKFGLPRVFPPNGKFDINCVKFHFFMRKSLNRLTKITSKWSWWT